MGTCIVKNGPFQFKKLLLGFWNVITSIFQTTEIERQLLNSTTTELRNVTYTCPTEKTISASVVVTEVGVTAAGLVGDALFGNFSNASLAQNCTRLELHNVTLEVDSDLCWETSIGQVRPHQFNLLFNERCNLGNHLFWWTYELPWLCCYLK